LISVAKFWISSAFVINITYTLEVYSTNIRILGLGICNFFGRVGGILMPLISMRLEDLVDNKYVPYYVFVGLSLLSSLLICFIPF
jgi:hypothetical protein